MSHGISLHLQYMGHLLKVTFSCFLFKWLLNGWLSMIQEIPPIFGGEDQFLTYRFQGIFVRASLIVWDPTLVFVEFKRWGALPLLKGKRLPKWFISWMDLPPWAPGCKWQKKFENPGGDWHPGWGVRSNLYSSILGKSKKHVHFPVSFPKYDGGRRVILWRAKMDLWPSYVLESSKIIQKIVPELLTIHHLLIQVLFWKISFNSIQTYCSRDSKVVHRLDSCVVRWLS